MSLPFSKWLRLPNRTALLLGLGALSAAGAQADTGRELARNAGPLSQTERTCFGDLVIWSEGGRFYLSEGGGPASELRLSETAEARHLMELLAPGSGHSGARPRSLNRMLLAGGGGNGISWAPVPNTTASGRGPTGDAAPKRSGPSNAVGGSPKSRYPATKTDTPQPNRT